MIAAVDALPKMWLGGHVHEAAAAYHRARNAGLSVLRALALANVASFRDGWAFRKTLAKHVGCSIRTIARALNQGREAGLVGVARAKKGEVARDEDGKPVPLPCGFSHRWTIGWGKAGHAVKAAIENARAKFAAKQLVNGKRAVPAARRLYRPRSVEELERELAARYPPRPPPEPPDRA